jgi:hypothetical protein
MSVVMVMLVTTLIRLSMAVLGNWLWVRLVDGHGLIVPARRGSREQNSTVSG